MSRKGYVQAFVPDNVLEWIKREAEREHRTVSGMVSHPLREAHKIAAELPEGNPAAAGQPLEAENQTGG